MGLARELGESICRERAVTWMALLTQHCMKSWAALYTMPWFHSLGLSRRSVDRLIFKRPKIPTAVSLSIQRTACSQCKHEDREGSKNTNNGLTPLSRKNDICFEFISFPSCSREVLKSLNIIDVEGRAAPGCDAGDEFGHQVRKM